MAGMKWWGWGDEGVSFTHEDKPDFRPFVKRHLELEVAEVTSRPVALAGVRIPEPWIAPALEAALEATVEGLELSTAPQNAVSHSRGKS